MGKSPFEILHGYLPRLDGFAQEIENLQERPWRPAVEIQQEVREAIEKSQEEYAMYYDAKRIPHIRRYNVGDVVMVERLPVHTGEPTKLQPKVRGPLVVIVKLRIESLSWEKIYECTAHCSQLRWYNPQADAYDQFDPSTDRTLEIAGANRPSSSVPDETAEAANDVSMRSIDEKVGEISMMLENFGQEAERSGRAMSPEKSDLNSAFMETPRKEATDVTGDEKSRSSEEPDGRRN